MPIILLIILFFTSILFFFLMLHLQWFIKTLREIASLHNPTGYTKLIQICFIFLLTALFAIIVIYYMLYPARVDRIDLILTVIVGWLGLIIGSFFGEKTMENLEERHQLGARKADLLMKKYASFLDKVSNLQKK